MEFVKLHTPLLRLSFSLKSTPAWRKVLVQWLTLLLDSLSQAIPFQYTNISFVNSYNDITSSKFELCSHERDLSSKYQAHFFRP
jgi:hypothetical protein